MQSSGFRAQGSGFRVRVSEFRVQDSGFRVQGPGVRVQGWRLPMGGCQGQGHNGASVALGGVTSLCVRGVGVTGSRWRPRRPLSRCTSLSPPPQCDYPRPVHRGTSLIKNTPPVGPDSSPMPREGGPGLRFDGRTGCMVIDLRMTRQHNPAPKQDFMNKQSVDHAGDPTVDNAVCRYIGWSGSLCDSVSNSKPGQTPKQLVSN